MSAEGPKMPEPAFSLDSGSMPCYTADQMCAYAKEATRQAMERCALIANSWSDKSFEAEQIEAEIRLAMADEIRSALSDVAAQEGKQHG